MNRSKVLATARGWKVALALVAGALLALPAVAKIDLVTIPERDHIQVTIYNSEDLTLVRESRQLTFREGINQIQFSWASSLIDPTSLHLFFPKESDRFEILDITYPAGTSNVLVWNVEAATPGLGAIEIVYFCSGLTWQADYVAKVSPDETSMSLESYVKVVNHSGEGFENAETRLVVGTVNLLEKIADLARRGLLAEDDVPDLRRRVARETMVLGAMAFDAAMPAAARAELKEVVKQAISEYQLYTIEGTEDLPDGWAKRLRSFAKDEVKIETAYEYDPRKWGHQVVKLYRLVNDAEHNLGENPLPDGVYRFLREDGQGGLVWQGQWGGKYIPVGEKIEANLGSDGLVIVEPERMNLRRTHIAFDSSKNVRGWDETEHWRIEIRNSRDEALPVKIVRYFSGDWSIDPKLDDDTTFKKRDRNAVEFETRVEALSTRILEYTLTTRYGTRSDEDASAPPPVAPPPEIAPGQPFLPQPGRPVRTR